MQLEFKVVKLPKGGFEIGCAGVELTKTGIPSWPRKYISKRVLKTLFQLFRPVLPLNREPQEPKPLLRVVEKAS